jgi:FkbM family methyltransferase
MMAADAKSETKKDKSAPKKSRPSLNRVLLILLLRIGRIATLWSRRGFFTLQKLYRRFLPADLLVRTKLDGGLLFDVNLRDDLGLYLWNFPDFYEKEEIEAFCSFIKPGTVVLDVGANFGLYTVLAAKRGARVFAIEPDPRNAAMLRHNIGLNRLEDKVTIFEIAATDAEKTVPLYCSDRNSGESNIMEKGRLAGSVTGRTIDSLNLPAVEVCKMDIEGSEFMALMGMQRTLERSPQIKLFVEYAEAFPDSGALLDFLKKNFPVLRVIEAPDSDVRGQLPHFCNIFATKSLG